MKTQKNKTIGIVTLVLLQHGQRRTTFVLVSKLKTENNFKFSNIIKIIKI